MRDLRDWMAWVGARVHAQFDIEAKGVTRAEVRADGSVFWKLTNNGSPGATGATGAAATGAGAALTATFLAGAALGAGASFAGAFFAVAMIDCPSRS